MEEKRRTIVMGGIARDYENACQKMLEAGMRWLKEHPKFSFTVFRSYKDVTGLVFSEDPEGKALLDAITSGTEGPTGAQVHVVTNHLNVIHNQGYDAWLSQAEKQDPSRVFEYDGTAASCPEGALDRDPNWRARTMSALDEALRPKGKDDAVH